MCRLRSIPYCIMEVWRQLGRVCAVKSYMSVGNFFDIPSRKTAAMARELAAGPSSEARIKLCYPQCTWHIRDMNMAISGNIWALFSTDVDFCPTGSTTAYWDVAMISREVHIQTSSLPFF